MTAAFIIILASVVAIDLISKWLATDIAHINTGISFGWGSDVAWLGYVIAVVAFAVAIVGIIWFIMYKKKTWVLTVGAALFIGGTLGNAVDRLISDGGVRDFIDMYFFRNNIADIAIIVGVVLLGVKFAFR